MMDRAFMCLLILAIALSACSNPRLTHEDWAVWKSDYEDAKGDLIDPVVDAGPADIAQGCQSALRRIPKVREQLLPAPDGRLDELVTALIRAQEAWLRECASVSFEDILDEGHQERMDTLGRESGRIEVRINVRIEQIDRELELEG